MFEELDIDETPGALMQRAVHGDDIALKPSMSNWKHDPHNA